MTDTATQPIPRKLNDGTIAAFAEGIVAGLPLERICQHIGVADSTWRRWRAQGETELANEPDPQPDPTADPDQDALRLQRERDEIAAARSPYARLCTAVQEGRLRAERRAVLALVNAAIGDEQVVEVRETRERWIRVYDEETKRYGYELRTETTTRTERRTVKDWRAALAWLERVHPETYARVTRQWISGPSGDGPVEISVEEMRSKVDAELQELAEKMAGLPMPGDLRELPGPLAEGPPVG